MNMMSARGMVCVLAGVCPAMKHRDDGERREEEEEGIKRGCGLNEESVSQTRDVAKEGGGEDLRMISQQGSVCGVRLQVKALTATFQVLKSKRVLAEGTMGVDCEDSITLAPHSRDLYAITTEFTVAISILDALRNMKPVCFKHIMLRRE